MIYDLHNDLLTASMAERKRALRDIGRSRPDMILCAVWTTECRPDENDYIRATDMDIPVPHRGAVEGLGGLRTDDLRGFLERRIPRMFRSHGTARIAWAADADVSVR